MSRIALVIVFLFCLSSVNCKKVRKRGKDNGCSFCNEYLGRSSDESGPGAESWDEHYMNHHNGQGQFTDWTENSDPSSESDSTTDNAVNDNGDYVEVPSDPPIPEAIPENIPPPVPAVNPREPLGIARAPTRKRPRPPSTDTDGNEGDDEDDEPQVMGQSTKDPNTRVKNPFYQPNTDVTIHIPSESDEEVSVDIHLGHQRPGAEAGPSHRPSRPRAPGAAEPGPSAGVRPRPRPRPRHRPSRPNVPQTTLPPTLIIPPQPTEFGAMVERMDQRHFQNGITLNSTPRLQPPEHITIDLTGFPNYDGNQDLIEGPLTPQESAAVCLLQTNNSRPYYYGTNQPSGSRGRIFYLPNHTQIAQRCQINFRQTEVGNAPIADLVCQSAGHQLHSVAQYRQQPCVMETNSNHSIVSTTPPPPESNLDLFANTNEMWHSCASIRHFSRKKRFANLYDAITLLLTVDGVPTRKRQQCAIGKIQFGSACIDKYYEKCPPHMINLNYFQIYN